MGHTPDTREPQYHVKTRAPPTISLCHCPQNTTAGRVWLYTLLYGNSLYRLYATAIHPSRLVPARPSRYTAYTAYTAIQLYTLYSIQHHTASLSNRGADKSALDATRSTRLDATGTRCSSQLLSRATRAQMLLRAIEDAQLARRQRCWAHKLAPPRHRGVERSRPGRALRRAVFVAASPLGAAMMCKVVWAVAACLPVAL